MFLAASLEAITLLAFATELASAVSRQLSDPATGEQQTARRGWE